MAAAVTIMLVNRDASRKTPTPFPSVMGSVTNGFNLTLDALLAKHKLIHRFSSMDESDQMTRVKLLQLTSFRLFKLGQGKIPYKIHDEVCDQFSLELKRWTQCITINNQIKIKITIKINFDINVFHSIMEHFL